MVSQTFALDLSVGWSASSPAYKKLGDGLSDAAIPSGISSDGKTWYLSSRGKPYAYDIETAAMRIISPFSSIPSVSTTRSIAGAIDPETGILYLLHGLSLKGLIIIPDRTYMIIYTPETGYENIVEMYTPLVPLVYYSVGWAKPIKAMLIFGGASSNGGNPRNSLFAYYPAKGWSQPTVKGDLPPPRSRACFVPAYKGTKMILFGGLGEGDTVLGDLYILDVSTMIWTRGSDAGFTGARMNHACATSKDFFVVWGGSTSRDGGPDDVKLNTTIIYNMITSRWTTEFNHSPTGASNPNAKPSESLYLAPGLSDTNGGQSSNTNLGAIIGGAVGGLAAVVILAAGIVFYRRRKSEAPPGQSNDIEDINHGNVNHTGPFLPSQGSQSPNHLSVESAFLNSGNSSHPVIPHVQGSSVLAQGQVQIDNPSSARSIQLQAAKLRQLQQVRPLEV
ncbi:hypothetical protein BX616_009826 [Lobosporangium transversale]|uniref:Galactose oxidase n=1 Tax=Lobosporangium transversale TaxID=64571 RepID=A0A1Y2H3F9_9FUNG|nr:hypothetical protein BCR41DRAFT_366740 [Lobosporangium transversale]KAF9918230.1 hypothetical protein BX616_009826 [Lobosporangium transversale]ORZ29087.1 hypothetical protein BCR41DRAFT_366740 [Lobosporangium transversale]|eukprot:XP_021886760.1 hypothetical protein BCR41DRAFT_366740 [Lobosporangium transversale]